jgi:hypothetical protein
MLHCAYVASQNPQVLFWGEASELRRLGAHIAQSAISGHRSTLDSDSSPGRVRLGFSEAPQGMIREDGFLDWEIAPSDGFHFAELIDALIHSGMGHQYLDCTGGKGIEVKVSLGEYPEDFHP